VLEPARGMAFVQANPGKIKTFEFGIPYTDSYQITYGLETANRAQ